MKDRTGATGQLAPALVGLFLSVACAGSGTTLAGSGGTTSAGGATSADGMTMGTGGTAGGSSECTGACCPTDVSCYSSAAGPKAPGAECLARRDNTGQKHVQLRQTWLHATAPAGNTHPFVYQSQNRSTQLPEPACWTSPPSWNSWGFLSPTGYMQLIDMDLTDPDPAKNTGLTGFASYVTDLAGTIKDGACFATVDNWTDKAACVNCGTASSTDPATTDFSLPADQMSSSVGWPKGLPPPRPQPWSAAPVKGIRVAKDFDLSKDRETILADLADKKYGPDLNGVFFYDEKTGVSHQYSPLAYVVMYDTGFPRHAVPFSMFLVPIREGEIRLQFHDPAHPNCVGHFLAEALDPTYGCQPANPSINNGAPDAFAWGGYTDSTPGEGDGVTHGYFLITELEQIYSQPLGRTLCVNSPGGAPAPDTLQALKDGWATDTDHRCRSSSKWNPSDGTAGLPMGDWCARTNSKATADCHDAYRSETFHAFQAFNIKSTFCKAL